MKIHEIYVIYKPIVKYLQHRKHLKLLRAMCIIAIRFNVQKIHISSVRMPKVNVVGILNDGMRRSRGSVQSYIMRILIQKAVQHINKFVPNYMPYFFLRRQKEKNRSYFQINEQSSVTHVRFTLFPSSIACGLRPWYATSATQPTKTI